MRRPISFLLMFFLLLTQQVAMSHAVTHWTPAALASAAGEERIGAKADFTAHACELCAAAQYASPVPVDGYRLQPPDPVGLVHVTTRERAAQAATRLAFRSRAPPSL
ncbi:hypothetical protein [Massilia niabensis]|uniref:DUF2946 domain-containing protein n=1 Tax=Massilia niabensis TaxID=544910 RepID=A0ABW0LA46_9BURK